MSNYKCIPPQDLLWAIQNLSCAALKAYCYFWAVAPYARPFDGGEEVTVEEFFLKTGISQSAIGKVLHEINNSKLFRVSRSKYSRGVGEEKIARIHIYNKHGVIAASNYVAKRNDEYGKFLNSEYWHDCRNKALARDSFQCQDCGTNQRLQVHHLTYEHLGQELNYLQDLITLCFRCHQKVHRKGENK